MSTLDVVCGGDIHPATPQACGDGMRNVLIETELDLPTGRSINLFFTLFAYIITSYA
jgi:hypothetical protein